MDASRSALERLLAGDGVAVAEARDAVAALLDGKVSEETAAHLLSAWRDKGVTAEELEGTVRAVRDPDDSLGGGLVADRLLDTCGTGGDRASTINLSTVTAIVVAAAGIPVVKHGNRACTSPSGSADVLAALGVEHDPEPAVSSRCLAEASLAFLFAPRYHPGLARLAASAPPAVPHDLQPRGSDVQSGEPTAPAHRGSGRSNCSTLGADIVASERHPSGDRRHRL